MAKKKKSQGMSIRTMAIWLGVVVAVILWCISAAMYDTAQGGRWVVGPADGTAPRRSSAIGMLIASIIVFVTNSVMYLPQFPSVIKFIFTDRIWFVVLGLLAEAGVVGFGFCMQRLEKQLDSGKSFKTNRKERQIAIPKPPDDD